MPALPQPRIPDYALIRLIGTGSYGDVWLARSITGAFRAVKIVWRDRFPDPRPFTREFEGITRFAAISLREPSQLALLHAGRDDTAGMFYYVMELADDAERGRAVDPEHYRPLTLREVFAQRGRLPVGEVVALGVALARALASLHAAGLVHRDVKPSNVIFVGGVPKLADVGLVAVAKGEQLTFVGTEGFVPPEGPGAPAADVFSLGKLLYELVTGLDRHDFPRLPPAIAEWPDRRDFLELNEVLLRACEGDAQRRYPDAKALLDDLLLLQAGKSVRRLRRAERHLARALRAAGVLAVATALAGTGAWIERRRAEAEQSRRAAAEAERDELARRTIYANTIGNAEHALSTGGFGKARQLLRELLPATGREDLRNFEWHALWAQAQGDPSTVWQEAGPAILKLALSSDGSRLAVLDAKREVALRDTATGRSLRTITGVARLAGFSADGRWLLGSDRDARLRAWSVEDGSSAHVSPAGPGQHVLGLLDGAEMVALANGSPAQLTVWDGGAGRVVAQQSLPTATDMLPWEYFRGAVSAPRRQAVIAWIKGRRGTEFRLTVIDLGAAANVRTHLVDRRVVAVGFDLSGAWAILAEDRRLWRPDAAGTWGASSELLPADTQQLAAAGDTRVAADREQLYWLDEAESPARTGRGSQGAIGTVVVAPGSGLVYSGTHDGELRVWPRTPPPANTTGMAVWNSHAAATSAVFSSDSRTLAVPLDGRTVALVDGATLAVRQRVSGLRFPVWMRPGAMLGPADDGDGVRRVALDGSHSELLLPAAKEVLQVHASRDGTVICASDSQGRLWVHRPGTTANAPLVTEGFQNRFALKMDVAGTRLWHAGRDNQLRCLNLGNGQEEWSAALPALAPVMELSPDGQTLAIPLENGRLEIRHAATGTLLHTVTLGGSTPQYPCYSPDGRRLFVAGSKGDITCLETEHWLQLNLFQLPATEPFHWMTMSPDGRTLALITKTGALHLLRAR